MYPHPYRSLFRYLAVGERSNVYYDTHQYGKMLIMIMKTPGSQVDFPVAGGK